MDNKKIIGNRINSALALRNMKQIELANKMNMKAANTISYFCKGDRVPNTLQLIEMAKILKVSVDYLLGLSDVPTTDLEIKGVCEYTGLSEQAVEKLKSFSSENKESWIMDVFNSFVESEDFDIFIYLIMKYATTDNQSIVLENYKMSTHDFEESKAQSILHDIMKEIKTKFKGKEDYRCAYKFLNSLYREGKISEKDFCRIENEFDNGDFSEL